MATVMQEPGQRPLHFPPMLHDLQALAGVLDHFQRNRMRALNTAHPVAQPLGLLPAVDPDLPQALHPGGTILLHQGDQVAYLLAADKYFRLLLIRLDGGTQPVSLTHNGFSRLRPRLLACI
jgi:hypothetical protein